MAAKKKAAKESKAKRPPKQIWITVDPQSQTANDGVFERQAWAKEHAAIAPGRREVVGPYVLAERVKNR